MTAVVIGGGYKLSSEGNLVVQNSVTTTPPIDSIFARSISSFTLSADATASTESTVNYDFTATAGHALSAGNEIVLQDPVTYRSFFATVLAVVTNTITVDRPIDFAFPSATTVGTKVSTNMAVDGSSTPVLFNLYAGGEMSNITRVIIKITDDAAMDTSKFGGITDGITRGLVFRSNKLSQTIFNFKTNGEIQSFCFDQSYTEDSVPGPSGTYGISYRVTFGSIGKHGTVLEFEQPTDLQWVVQDDLTDLLTCRVIAQGRQSGG